MKSHYAVTPVRCGCALRYINGAFGLPGHWPKGFEAPATVQPGFGA